MNHLDELTCLLYLEGQLSAERSAALIAHTRTCPDCSALLHVLEQETALLRGALSETEEAVPARLLAPRSARATWVWALSLGLAALGVFALWTEFIEPWQQQLEQVGFGSNNLLTMFLFGGIFWEGWLDMLNLIQFLAAIITGTLGLVLLHRWLRRRPDLISTSGSLVTLGLLLAGLALPSGAAAAEAHKAETFRLAKDDVIPNDLVVYAGSVRIEGTVEGDLILFASQATITGKVHGDILAFAQTLRVEGEVGGNIRAIVNTLLLNGIVQRNVTTFAEVVTLDNNTRIEGSLMLFTGHCTLDGGQIARDVTLFAEQTSLNGRIGGNLTVSARSLNIGPEAELLGTAKFRGRQQPSVSPQARLASPLVVEIEPRLPRFLQPKFYLWQSVRWAAAFLLGAVLLLLLPGFYHDVQRRSAQIGASVGFGLLGLLATPIAVVLVCLTVVGLALGLGTLLLYAVAAYAGHIFFSAWLGRRLLGPNPARGVLLSQLALGLLLYRIAANLPYVGWLATLLATAWGFGALVLVFYDRIRPKPDAPAAVPAA
ncbi:MAG: zf-HC2 domain-containing protein [Firmicutes bacterium]|nr:zf-HC2 domain-containing protein [Bacillota bacterium]